MKRKSAAAAVNHDQSENGLKREVEMHPEVALPVVCLQYVGE